MDYLIYILIGWGITDILVNGSILNGIRNFCLVKIPFLGKLFTCIQCSGFWVGIFLGLLSLLDVLESPLWDFIPVARVLASGFLISGCSVVINSTVFSLLSKRTKINNTDNEED
jgi:hypothetical protein